MLALLGCARVGVHYIADMSVLIVEDVRETIIGEAAAVVDFFPEPVVGRRLTHLDPDGEVEINFEEGKHGGGLVANGHFEPVHSDLVVENIPPNGEEPQIHVKFESVA